MHKAEIKWFLNVLTSLSVASIQCMCGGTSLNLQNIDLGPLILHYPLCVSSGITGPKALSSLLLIDIY